MSKLNPDWAKEIVLGPTQAFDLDGPPIRVQLIDDSICTVDVDKAIDKFYDNRRQNGFVGVDGLRNKSRAADELVKDLGAPDYQDWLKKQEKSDE